MERLPLSEKAKFTGAPVDAQGRLIKTRLPTRQAESLTAMNEDYAFFTLAPSYLYGMLGDGILIDFINDGQEDCPFHLHKFNRPVFSGLHTPQGDADWNHVLFAIPRPFWEPLTDFLCSITMSLREQDLIVRYGMQELVVLDPLRVDKTVVCDTQMDRLTIGAFCPYGNKYKGYFVTDPQVPDAAPKFRLHHPTDDMQVFARAHFQGRNPINAKESFLWRKSQEEPKQ